VTLDEWSALSPQQQRRQFYLELKAYWVEQCAKGKALKLGWVAQKYRARFGRYPPDGAERLTAASEVSPFVRDWIRDQQIAFHTKQRGLMGAKPTSRRSAGAARPDYLEPAGDA